MWMNENIKLQYIEELKDTPTVEIFVRRFFNKAAKHEEQYGKDICDWNMNEIIAFYCSLLSRTGATIYNINSIFKKYTDYCMARNLTKDSINHYYEISEEVIFKSCVNSAATEQRVFTREELLKKIRDLRNPSDKYLILGMFEGICGKDKIELANVSPEDIDSNNMITLCTGRRFQISDELVAIINESADEYRYTGCNINGEEYERNFMLDDKGAYKRMTGSNAELDNGTRMAHNINNRISKMGIITSSKALQNAGKIDFCKKLIKERNISLADALKDQDTIYRYGETKSIKQFLLKYENILGDL